MDVASRYAERLHPEIVCTKFARVREAPEGLESLDIGDVLSPER